MAMTPVLVDLDLLQIGELADLKQRTGKSRNELIRAAIDTFFKLYNQEETNTAEINE